MNILVLSPYSAHNPTEGSFTYSPAKEYQKQGHNVRVIAFSPFGKSSPGWKGKYTFTLEQQCVDGVEFYRLRHLSLSKFGEDTGFNRRSLQRAVEKQLSTLLHGFQPDIIHAHSLWTGEIALWLKEQLSCPVVITTHGTDTSGPFEKGDYAKIRQSVCGADAVVAVSSVLQRKLMAAGIPQNVRVILNGAQLQFSAPTAPKCPLSLIQVGNLIAQKKGDITIRAFAKLRQTHPEASLTFVGQGPERTAYEALCRDLGLSDTVRFTGRLPNQQVLEAMSRSQFFVMPSVREGFGIVYLEAMACGCVTIGTEGEGIADLIVSGENGFLVPPDDPDAIVRVIEDCLQAPELAGAIAKRGEQAARDLTWEQNAAQYLALFEELIEKKR